MSNSVRLAEVESDTGLHAGWDSWRLGATPLYMGPRASRLSGVSELCVVMVTGWSASAWLVATAESGAQYRGDELMKFKGEAAGPAEVEPGADGGWWATGGVEGPRSPATPLAEMVGASGTGFRGKLVSWIPAGMVRISFPCWTLR